MGSDRDARGVEAPASAGAVAVVDPGAAAGGHVFVSFASRDREVADRLVASLETGNVRCWIAHRDIQPGGSYPAAISAALRACGALLLVLTSAAGRSRHVLREIEMAFNAGKPILAVRLGGAPLRADFEYFLSTTQWLDAGEDLDEAEIDRVRRRLRELVAGPAEEADRGSGAPARSRTAALYGSWRFWAPVLAFHAISIVMASTDLVFYLAPASYAMAVGTGMAVVALTGHCNIPVLFTVAFLQPVLVYLPEILSLPPQVLRALPVGLPVWIGALCASGGTVMTLRHGLPDASVLSLAGWRAWIAPTWSLLRKAEKLETAFKGLAVLIGVLGWLLRLF
jgi:hypothetical protein